MISHKFNCILGLEKKLIYEPLLLLGILATRHKEIVANQYSLSVALIVECELLEQAAAPHSKYVSAHFSGVSHKCADLPITLLGLEGIARYPVSAAAEYFLFINYNAEAEEVIIKRTYTRYGGLNRLTCALVILTSNLVFVVNYSYSSYTEGGIKFRCS